MKSRVWKAVRTLFAVCLIAGISYLAGAITANENKPNRSAVALQKTGLPLSYSQHYTLHGASSGRDYFSQTVFQVDYSSERKDLFNIMSRTKNWRIEKVSAKDFRAFTGHTWYPEVVQVTDDIEFDAWYYLETSEPSGGIVHEAPGMFESIGLIGRGFEFAVFDVDTGLFIFIDQFG